MTKPIISADSHITEPPGTYVERIDARFRDRAPHVIHDPKRGDLYVIDGLDKPIPMGHVAAAGKRPELTVFGDDYPTADGTCVRDFIHVSDLAEAHVEALEHLMEGGRSQTLNSARTRASRAPNGSSSSSTFGSGASARARAIRCRWPPDSCEG